MKSNIKVTQKEYQLPEGEIIVSRTDLLGNIVEANEAFIGASGYEWSELVGQAHNILRHPDVPSAVFKDFWRTLQDGKPWSQIVKNRRKNGDHYWVVANATPIFENGEITGYMSVRTPASREQVVMAEQAYRDIASERIVLNNGNTVQWSDKFNLRLQFDTFSIIPVFAALLLLLTFGPLLYPPILDVVPLIAIEAVDLLLVGSIIYLSLFSKKRIKTLITCMTDISEGKFDNELDTRGKSLIAEAFNRLQSMQVKLGADVDEIQATLNRSQRVESALMATSSNIMVADRFRSIIFMNDSVMQTLKSIEPELQKMLPNFDCDNLLHQKIDIFHQHPEHQAKLLDELTTTYNARIKVGKITIDLVIDPIFDDHGNRIGTVAEWKDMTEKLMIEDNIASIINAASKGRLSDRIETKGLTGFEAKISMMINELLTQFSNTTDNLNKVLASMEQGDLTNSLTGDYEGELLDMKNSTNAALHSLNTTLDQVNRGAMQLGSMASEVALASEDLSARTQQQAASLEEASASIEELTSALEQASGNSANANNLAHQSMVKAQDGVAVMSETLEAMDGISEMSQKIGEITSVIDSIAFQTNLLALNAAVEAARAGEHGRGFAVVAGEVRNLAQKSAEAAKTISGLIESTVKQIDHGTGLVQKSNQVFEEVAESIQEVGNLVEAITKTEQEQAKGMYEVNSSVRGLDELTQQNAALVEELSATASNMSGETGNQSEFIQQFTLLENLDKKDQPPLLN